MANEKRLIDFEKARKKVLEILHSKVTTVTAVKVAIAMKNAAVDAVEVVRCKDCKHRGDDVHCPMRYEEVSEYDDGDGYMEVDYMPHDRTSDNGFCDRGERKNND